MSTVLCENLAWAMWALCASSGSCNIMIVIVVNNSWHLSAFYVRPYPKYSICDFLFKTHKNPCFLCFTKHGIKAQKGWMLCFITFSQNLPLQSYWNICRSRKCRVLWHTSVPSQTIGFAQNSSTFYLTISYWFSPHFFLLCKIHIKFTIFTIFFFH